MDISYQRRLTWLVAIATLLRMLLAGFTELGNDEAYYWTYAEKLQWNYFDHPPMVAVWIRIFTLNGWLANQELFIRLGSIVSAAISTIILYKLVLRLHSGRAAYFTASLYTASLYAGIIAGVFIMPDSPQMLFWCASLYAMTRIAEGPGNWRWWLLFGAFAGLCLMSKVHAVFLWFGLGGYILFLRREWLRLPQLYISFLVTALIASPIIFWNIEHDFITYRFHSERVTVNRFALNLTGFAREVFGQFFYNNPFNVTITATALAAAWKVRVARVPALRLFSFMALPMIFILLAVSLFRNTFPHWSGPAYVTLLPLAGIYLSEKRSEGFPKSLRGALITISAVALLGLLMIRFFPGTLGKKENDRYGKGDFTLDMNGWRQAGSAFSKLASTMEGNGEMLPEAPLVSPKWFPAAHLDYYFARPDNRKMIGLGSLIDLHHYHWMNAWRAPQVSLQNAWAIVPGTEPYDAKEVYTAYYYKVTLVATIISKRSGVPARSFAVYKLSGWKGAPVPVLFNGK